MEPMNLGSPANSPGSNQSQYLPPFLLGDPQSLTPHKNTLSPKTGRYNVSFATSPGGCSSHELNRSYLNTRTLFAAQGGPPVGHNVSQTAVGANGTMNGHAQSHSHHQAGPPIQGLFDSLREQAVTPQQRNHLGMLQLQSPNQSYQSSYHTNDSFAPGAPNATNASMRVLCSPMGANHSVTAGRNTRQADFWVTIFGFSSAASSMVLQHFTVCGTIVDVVHAPQNGNWMHVRFSSHIECDKALNYNQKIIAGNVMVGVARCTEGSVLEKENSSFSVNAEASNPPTSPSSIRPLTQHSYKLARKEDSVSPENDGPQMFPRSAGLMEKAIDLIFGW